MPKHNPHSIVLIYTDNRGNEYYPSVAEAARSIGIPRQRLFEALQSKSGLVKWTDPPIYIDCAAETYDVEKDIDEEEEDE